MLRKLGQLSLVETTLSLKAADSCRHPSVSVLFSRALTTGTGHVDDHRMIGW